jgi:hypothetical protein
VSDANQWKRCSSCKTSIAFTAKHWVCNVSTCNRPRTGLAFCTVSCWEAHVPVMRHRESWALERTAPTRAEFEREQTVASSAPPAAGETRRTAAAPARAPAPPLPDDVLVVASKLKAYVRARSGMNTSDGVMEALSAFLRALCDDAIRKAGADGRKTVMDRDFPQRR